MMLSPDISTQTSVDACLLNGMVNNMNLCMNGCRFDTQSCLNKTYIDLWNDPKYARERLTELQRTGGDLLKQKCGGPKFFVNDDNQMAFKADFSLPSQKHAYLVYQSCVLKDNYDYLYSLLFNKTIPFIAKQRDTATSSSSSKRKQKRSPARHLDQCLISLDRFDDDQYMEDAMGRLGLDKSITMSEQQSD
jgi:hypothetical protein